MKHSKKILAFAIMTALSMLGMTQTKDDIFRFKPKNKNGTALYQGHLIPVYYRGRVGVFDLELAHLPGSGATRVYGHSIEPKEECDGLDVDYESLPKSCKCEGVFHSVDTDGDGVVDISAVYSKLTCSDVYLNKTDDPETDAQGTFDLAVEYVSKHAAGHK